jgi:hypothetical protein
MMPSLNFDRRFKIGPNIKPFVIVALTFYLKREFWNKKSDHVKCNVLGPPWPLPNLAPITPQLYELFAKFVFTWNNIFENGPLNHCPPSFYNLLRPIDLDNVTLLLITLHALFYNKIKCLDVGYLCIKSNIKKWFALIIANHTYCSTKNHLIT